MWICVSNFLTCEYYPSDLIWGQIIHLTSFEVRILSIWPHMIASIQLPCSTTWCIQVHTYIQSQWLLQYVSPSHQTWCLVDQLSRTFMRVIPGISCILLHSDHDMSASGAYLSTCNMILRSMLCTTRILPQRVDTGAFREGGRGTWTSRAGIRQIISIPDPDQ